MPKQHKDTFYVHNKDVLCYVAVEYEKKKEQMRAIEFSKKMSKEIA